jgi:molybdate transport system substrate-binding protein
MMKKLLKSFVVAALLIVCDFGASSHATLAQSGKTLTVFAASSLTDAFKEIETAFEAAHPGVEVIYSFGSSSSLAAQLKEGAPADVFACANNSQMTVVQEAKRIAGTPRTFAQNRLMLIVPAENPAKITSLKDLAKPGIKLVVAAPKVPVRDYTDAMLEKLVNVPEYGEAYKAAVIGNFVSEEDNVRQVSAKVALGEADAGIVYRSDVTPDITRKVIMLPIPDEVNTLATYPIAVTNDSTNADLAQTYMDYILSDEGQRTLAKWNFITVAKPSPPMSIIIRVDTAL